MNNQQIILDSSGASSFVVELDIALSTTLSNKAQGLYLVQCGLAERQNDLFKKDLINHSTHLGLVVNRFRLGGGPLHE